MSIEGQGHFFTIYFPGFVCFVLYLAKISGERLQDHWSSGLIILVKTSKFSDGQAKMAKNGGLNQFNIYLLTNIFQFYQLPLTSMFSPIM